MSDVNDNVPSISPEDLRLELRVEATCCTSYVKLTQLRVFDDDKLRERDGGILERVPLAPSDFRISMSDQCNGSRFLSVLEDGGVFWQPGAAEAVRREAVQLWERLVDAGEQPALASPAELSLNVHLTLCLLVVDKHSSASAQHERKENVYVTLRLSPEFLAQPSAEVQACVREPERCLRAIEAPVNYTIVSVDPEYVLQETYSDASGGRPLCLIRPLRQSLGQLRLVNRSTDVAIGNAQLRLDERTLIDAKLEYEVTAIEMYTSAGTPEPEFAGRNPLRKLQLVELSESGQLTLLWPPAQGALYTSERSEPCERERERAGSKAKERRTGRALPDEAWGQADLIDWLNVHSRLELRISLRASYSTTVLRRTPTGRSVARPGSRVRLALTQHVAVRVQQLNYNEVANNLFMVRFSGAGVSWEEYTRANMVDNFRNWMRAKTPHPFRDEEPLLVGIRQFSTRAARSLHVLYYLFPDERFSYKQARMAERLADVPQLWGPWREFSFTVGHDEAKPLETCPLDQCVKAYTARCVPGVRFNLTTRDTYVRVTGGASSPDTRPPQYLVPRFYENRYCACKTIKLGGTTLEEYGGLCSDVVVHVD